MYDLIKKNGAGKGEEVMWRSVALISDYMESHLAEDEKKELMRDIYALMSSGHYNEEFAKEDVEKMYYVDAEGEKHYAPYWSVAQVQKAYESVLRLIPTEYNFWDFYVALQMVKSDSCPLLHKWFPGATDTELEGKLVELAVAYLNDEDNPFGKEKVWRYLNGGR